jgi:hypothetical protein
VPEEGIPAKLFQCPSHHGLAEGETAYAMISGVENPAPLPSQILLVEVLQPQDYVPFDKATFDEGVGSHHPGGMNVGLRSGAVRFISKTIKPELWQQLLDGPATEVP